MRRQRKKFKSPRHPWQASRIEEENKLLKEYGLRKKTEVWRAEYHLRNWSEQAKEIASLPEDKKEKAKKTILAKLQKYGIVDEKADLDDVLSLTLRDILEKRLQTVVYRKGLALTPKQARQFVVHNKIIVNSKKINSPAHLVKAMDEISFVPGFTPKLFTKKEEIPRPEDRKEVPEDAEETEKE